MTDYKLTEDGLYAYRYPRASVTADAVLFAERDGQTYVLLIQRGNDPYKGYWAFPGGFLEMDETVARCAERTGGRDRYRADRHAVGGYLFRCGA